MLRVAELISSSKLVKHNTGWDFNKRILSSTGLWPLQDVPRDLGYHLRFYLPRLQVALALIFSTVVFPMGVYANWGDVTAVSECITCTFLSCIALVKTGSPLFLPEQFQRLVQRTEEICNRRYHGYTESERRIRNNTQILTDLSTVYNTSGFVMCFSYSLGFLPYYLTSRRQYVGGWYPYDEYTTPYFEITLALLSFFLCSLSLLAVVDALLITILMRLIGQFKLLRQNIMHIRLSSNEAVNAKKQYDATDRSHPNHFGESDSVLRFKRSPGESMSSWDCLRHQLNLPQEVRTMETEQNVTMCPTIPQQMHVAMNVREREMDLEMKRRLADCIQHHQELCSLKDDIQSTFHEILVLQIIFCFIPSVSIVIWAAMVKTIIEVRALGFFFMMLVSMFEWFMFCYLGHKMTEEDTKVREAVYGIDWYEASTEFKKSMCIIMSKCNKPIAINVAGFIPLSMVTCFNVIHHIFSYYTTLRSTIKA